jgi:uncharacterized membrane protein YdjX (TVP38/TMEM64 family)
MKERKKRWYWMGGLLAVLLLLILIFRHQIAEGLMIGYRWVSNREQMEQFVTGFGNGAPFVFMAIQIFQVVLAPIPGEATGFIGGYLFGWVKGFIYSSVSLAIGSWINFGIGRFLGSRYVRSWLPKAKLERFDKLVKRQGIIVLFILFVFPGFPKDYLCLFLGITSIPTKIFLFIASIGRMPGTLMLSVQGEFLFQKNYLSFSVAFTITLLLVVLSIRYRERIYKWMEKMQ